MEPITELSEREFVLRSYGAANLSGDPLDEAIHDLVTEGILKSERSEILRIGSMLGIRTTEAELEAAGTILAAGLNSREEFAIALSQATGSHPEAMHTIIGVTKVLAGGLTLLAPLVEEASQNVNCATVAAERLLATIDRFCGRRST